MTNRTPYIPPEQHADYHKSSFPNEAAEPEAPAAPAAPTAKRAAKKKPVAKKPARK